MIISLKTSCCLCCCHNFCHFAYIYKRSDQTNPVRQDLYFGDCFPKNVSKMRLWGTFILTPCLKCHSGPWDFFWKRSIRRPGEEAWCPLRICHGRQSFDPIRRVPSLGPFGPIWTRAGKSKSLIQWKRRKGGKRREKAEKADLVMQLAFWQTCQNAIKCHEMTKCLHFGSGSCIRIFF